MSKQARKATTIKIKGRKYIVVHATVARISHKNAVVQLVKRAGKVQWFTLEDGVLTRHKGFWPALEAYSVRQEALGMNPTDELTKAQLDAIIGRTPEEVEADAEALEVAANA